MTSRAHTVPGKRRGPKLKPNRKVPYGTKLRPDQIAWLRSQGPRQAASELEKAIDMRRAYLLRPVTLRWDRKKAHERVLSRRGRAARSGGGE